MSCHDPRNLSDGQFSLSFAVCAVTFFCTLCVVISARNAVGLAVWSLAGVACSTRLTQTYLRRSVGMMFVGFGIIAIGAFHIFGFFSMGIAAIGGVLAFSGAGATLFNAFDRGP